MKLSKILLVLLCISTFTFTSCSTDDEIPVPDVIRTGSFTVEDQTLMDNMITISNINVTQQSYLVLRRGDANGEMIAEPTLINKGESTDVTIELMEGVELEDGETIAAILHKDIDNLGFFDFDEEGGYDEPIVDESGEVVMDTFTVTVLPEPTGSFSVEDQASVNNMITLDTVTLDRAGYVVVHADTADTGANAPVVPEIISEPVYLEEGTHTDVEIMIEESADLMTEDVVWVMLHTDTGEEGVYEFDGQNGLDMPILDEEGAIVMESITITGVENDSDATAFADFDQNNDEMLDRNEVSGTFVNDFDMWDTDDDGVLSENEFNTTFFGNTDTNDDDAISEDEWDLGFSGLFGDYFADTDFATLDADADGSLSTDEWDTAVTNSAWFDTYDADTDSSVSEAELDEGLFGDWDMDDNDSINEDEFNNFTDFTDLW